jgi:peptide/nickel transport system substrate-binding protein
VLALLVSACGSSSAVTTTALQPNAEGLYPVRAGGTLVFASQEDPASFNLNTTKGATSAGQMIMERVWPQVFVEGPQLRPTLDTNLVESAELVSTSPQTIVYTINPKAVWSDGVPITAEDFIYNWQAQSGTGVDVDGKPYDVADTSGYRNIQSVTGSNGGRTVTVVFKEPYGDWERLFSNLLPAHIAARVGWNTGFDTFQPSVVISGGPFMVTSYSPGHELVLSRNPHYWARPAHLDRIIFRMTPDPGRDPALLDGRHVDLVYPAAEADLIDQIRHVPHVTTEVGHGLQLENLDFNEHNLFLADVKVRQAIALAIDRDQVVSGTVGQFAPSTKPLGNHLFANTQPQYQDNSTTYAHADVVSARRLLESDGYTTGLDGYLQKDGKPLELRITTTSEDPLRLAAEQIIVDQLQVLGVKLDVVNLPTAVLYGSALPQGNYDLAIFSSTVGPFASSTVEMYGGVDPQTGSGRLNWTGYSDPAVDALYQQAAVELNDAKATTIYNQIDAELWSRMVSLPLYQDPTFLAYSSRFTNISDNPSSSGPFWDAENWGLKLTSKK